MTAPRPWVDVARSRAERLRRSRESVVEQEKHLADAIRAALAEGATVLAIAEAVGLSRERIYQIRDGRR